MYFPFITKRGTKARSEKVRRKGGGGKGGGRGGSGGKSRGGSGTSTGGGRGGSVISGPAVSVGGSNRVASSMSYGGGPPIFIPSGAPFAGRTSGGANRTDVYGDRQYGSGYPGTIGAGVSGRGFPFHFWPIAWGAAAGVGTATYLHNSEEYGQPNNASRPGGPLYTAYFVSKTDTSWSATTSSRNAPTSTFRVVSDESTVKSLVGTIFDKCRYYMARNSQSQSYTPFGTIPKPENAIQYYRASSVVLTLDGYNNSAVWSDDRNAPHTPLPMNVSQGLLTCLNETIGKDVLLVRPNGVGSIMTSGLSPKLALAVVLMRLFSSFIT